MDTTAVLAEILRQELDDVAFFGIYDPRAVEQAIAAGVGARVKLSIGGKLAMPALGRPNPPLTVEATVKTISIGSFTSRSASNKGVKVVLGPTVVLDTGRVEIVLLSKHVEPIAIDMLSVLGIDPARQALRRHQEPRPLASGPRQARGRHRRMRGARRLHLELRRGDLQESAPPDLPARSGHDLAAELT